MDQPFSEALGSAAVFGALVGFATATMLAVLTAKLSTDRHIGVLVIALSVLWVITLPAGLVSWGTGAVILSVGVGRFIQNRDWRSHDQEPPQS